MAENKIGIADAEEKHLYFSKFVKENYVLVDGKYACVTMKSTTMAYYALASIRVMAYLSKQFHEILLVWLQSGEFEKFQRLSNHIESHVKGLQSESIVYLNKLAPPQAIDSKSIV